MKIYFKIGASLWWIGFMMGIMTIKNKRLQALALTLNILGGIIIIFSV